MWLFRLAWGIDVIIVWMLRVEGDRGQNPLLSGVNDEARGLTAKQTLKQTWLYFIIFFLKLFILTRHQ